MRLIPEYGGTLSRCTHTFLLAALLAVLGFAPERAAAQGIPDFVRNNPTGGISQGGAARSPLAAQDTTKAIPNIRRIDPERQFAHRHDSLPAQFAFERYGQWERRDSLAPAFVQTLGQTGKPLHAWRFGLPDRYMELHAWRHPVWGRPDLYVLDPATQLPWYDTHTPYVNLHYGQGPRSLQALHATVSFNPSRAFNFSLLYVVRRAEGAYREMSTNHRAFAAGMYYRHPGRRYHLFANLSYNSLTDALNGGAALSPVDSQPAYNKALERLLLSGSQQRRQVSSLYTDQVYHLFGAPDSAGQSAGQRLSLRLKASLEGLAFRFQDNDVDAASLSLNPLSPYPTLSPDISNLADSYRLQQARIGASVSYSWVNAAFRLNAQAGAGWHRLHWVKDTTAATLAPVRWITTRISEQRPGIWAQLQASTPGGQLSLNGRVWQTYSNLFQTESGAEGRVALHLGQRRADSLHLAAAQAFRLWAFAGYGSRNPSLFERYYPSRPADNRYLPNPDLTNARVLQARFGIQFDGRPYLFRKDTAQANYLSLQPFVAQIGRPLYFSAAMAPQQGEDVLRSAGAELDARLRMKGHFYLYGQLSAQAVFAPEGADEDLVQYGRSQPAVHGKIGIFYDQANLKIARRLRIGGELNGFSTFQGLAFDVLSAQFYPSGLSVQPYVRADVFATVQIKRAWVWLKVVHANEYFLLRGYYSTPFYPEYERTILLGINWSFFD